MEDRTLLSTLTVMNNNDSGKGSLRAAIAAAQSGDTIAFSSKLDGKTIALTSGELLITDSVTIDGPGANQLAVSGNNASRVFEVAAGQNVTISGLTITHGYAADQGGGILNDGSNLTLSGDNITQNVAFESATSSGTGRGPPEPGRHSDHRPAARSPATRRWVQPAHRQPATRLAAASTSPRAVRPSAAAQSAATSLKVVTTAPTGSSWAGAFLRRYRPPSPPAPSATTWPAEATTRPITAPMAAGSLYSLRPPP